MSTNKQIHRKTKRIIAVAILYIYDVLVLVGIPCRAGAAVILEGLNLQSRGSVFANTIFSGIKKGIKEITENLRSLKK